MIKTFIDASRIASYARAAGWDKTQQVTAVAVCLAESGGWVEAVNPLDGVYISGYRDFGLWQISVLGASHPELFDPQTNANRAYALWSVRQWQPWVAYTTGAHLKFMEVASAAVAALDYPVVRLSMLQPGLRNNDVKMYQEHLRIYIPGAVKLNPSGATGFYGSETKAMTKYAYTNVLHLYGGDLTVPGPSLVRYIKLNPI